MVFVNIEFLGAKKLHFIVTDASGKRQFTFLGAILTILVVGFSCLLAMAQRYYESVNSIMTKDKENWLF